MDVRGEKKKREKRGGGGLFFWFSPEGPLVLEDGLKGG